jgi:hypothetical protein
MREIRGASIGNTMVSVQYKRSDELSEMYSFTDFATAGQDGFALVSFLACFRGRIQFKNIDYSCPYFLHQVPEFILQILLLSKYAHSNPIQFDAFNLAS